MRAPHRKPGPAPAASRAVAVTVRAQQAAEVVITGDFTGWSPEGIPLKRGSQGEFRATLSLEPGQYQYRLRIDGQWADHAEAPRRVPNPFGTDNCVLDVPA
jgi:hypothetical protein